MSKLVVTLGAGGVGKTTLSIALACHFHEQGKRVGVLSIDPSKRLAHALGLSLGGQVSEIKTDLFAAIVDQKQVFDQMLKKYIKNEKSYEFLVNHKLYKSASQYFGGAIEYMALMKAYNLLQQVEVLILDTPPDSHAIDFLSKPNSLTDFYRNNVMKWLIKPVRMASKAGLFSLAGKLASSLSKITGAKTLEDVIEFIYHMEPLISGFHNVGEKMKEKFEQASYVLISSPYPAPFASIRNMQDELQTMGYCKQFWLQNRVPADEVNNSFDHRDVASAQKVRDLANKHRLQMEQDDRVKCLTQGKHICIYETEKPVVSLEEITYLAKEFDGCDII